jgi:hypothetical protein
MGARGAGLLALLVASAAAPGCRGPAQVRYEEALEQAPAPAAHAVHGERLVDVMRALERLRDERLPAAFDVEAERERRGRRVSEVALAMAAAAERIPPAAAERPLDPAERAEFLRLADGLARRARHLAEAAPRLEPQELRGAIEGIEQTCSACHGRFRPL